MTELRPRDGDVAAVEPQVVCDEGPAGPDARCACRRVRAPRAGVRHDGRERTPADLRQGSIRSVEKAGQSEDLAGPRGEGVACRQRLGELARDVGAARISDRDERDDVEHAEARVRTLVDAYIQGRDDRGCQGADGAFEVGARDREHRAVVPRVAVDVEKGGANELCQTPDDPGAGAFGDVDDRFEHDGYGYCVRTGLAGAPICRMRLITMRSPGRFSASCAG